LEIKTIFRRKQSNEKAFSKKLNHFSAKRLISS
jgi:hypothetical protein